MCRYKLRWVLDEKGRLPGQLRKPTDLCFLDSDNLVVAEARNSRLQIFGRRRQVCVDRSVAPDLVHPTSICQSRDGYLMLVADLNQVSRSNLNLSTSNLSQVRTPNLKLQIMTS